MKFDQIEFPKSIYVIFYLKQNNLNVARYAAGATGTSAASLCISGDPGAKTDVEESTNKWSVKSRNTWEDSY